LDQIFEWACRNERERLLIRRSFDEREDDRPSALGLRQRVEHVNLLVSGLIRRVSHRQSLCPGPGPKNSPVVEVAANEVVLTHRAIIVQRRAQTTGGNSGNQEPRR
jgi:hypothetical protein